MTSRPVPPGAAVAIVALSSPVRSDDELEVARRRAEELGLVPHFLPGTDQRGGEGATYLAGDDDVRAASLVAALEDPSFAAVWCLRGGYGSARLLRRLPAGILARHPKPIIGFSDATSILNARVAAGHVAIHGPMPATWADGREGLGADRAHLAALLAAPAEPWSLQQRSGGFEAVTITPGSARGPLVGGNLSVFHTLAGTPWMPPMEGAILFLEELNEAPYRIDRMVTHLLNSGALDGIAGVALGTFTEQGEPSPKALDAALRGLGPVAARVPVLAGLPCGHGPRNAALPLGAVAVLDGGAGDVRVGAKASSNSA